MYHRFEFDQLVRAVAPSTRAHWHQLGFADRADYIAWRWKRGLRAGHELSWSEKFAELGTVYLEFERKRAAERYRAAPEAFLRGVCAGRIQHWALQDRDLGRVAETIQFSGLDPVNMDSLAGFIGPLAGRYGRFVLGRCPEGDRLPVVRALILMHDYRPYWVRDPDGWEMPEDLDDRPDAALGLLARHLFDLYGDVPAFLDTAWSRMNGVRGPYREWFVHLGRGGSLKSLDMPLKLTRRMRHLLRQVPEGYSVEQALRWAQAKGLGLDDRFARAVTGSRLGHCLDDDPFWVRFMCWLRDSPDAASVEVGPLVDYLYAQKFDVVILEADGGGNIARPPPQPGLSLRGRTFRALCREMHAWHFGLRRLRLKHCRFPDPPAGELRVEVAAEEGTVAWTARPLRDTQDLLREGEEMRHCVATYNERCASGNYRVWSLARNFGNREVGRLTLMLNRHGQIVDVRGWANRALTALEEEAVERFLSLLCRVSGQASGDGPEGVSS